MPFSANENTTSAIEIAMLDKHLLAVAASTHHTEAGDNTVEGFKELYKDSGLESHQNDQLIQERIEVLQKEGFLA